MNLFGEQSYTPEPTSIKEAGFNYVWGSFIDQGLDSRRSFARLDRLDEVDEFAEGYNEAIDKIANLTEYDEGRLLFFEAAQGLPPQELIKLADKVNLPDEKMRGFLEASQLVLESNHDLNKIAWNGPNQQETEAMNNFEMGKVAAFNALVEMAEDGAGMTDIFTAIDEELSDQDVKIASEDDRDYRLGVESVCHDAYVKVAELYGMYDTDSADESELVEALLTAMRPDDLEKEASDEGDEFYDNVVDYLNENLTEDDIEKVAEVILDTVYELPLEKEASEEEIEHYNAAVDFLNEFDDETQEKIAEVIFDNVDEEVIEELEKEASATQAVKNMAQLGAYGAKQVGKGLMANKKKAGAGLVVAGVAAKKMRDKKKAKAEGEKTASDDKLENAFNLLREAGLLDD